MRSDMYKVIVERPRKGKGWIAKGARRRFDADGPVRAGMRAGIGRPHLNENLSPLERFLHKQVGRPWDGVMSEISANIDRRDAVQLHIYAHLEQFVATKVVWRDGRLVDLHRWFGWDGGDGLRQPLFVDPRTGLLRCNRDYAGWKRRRKERQTVEADELARRRRRIDQDRWHLLLDGEWYEVKLAPLPAVVVVEDQVNGRTRARYRAERSFDIVLKQPMWRNDSSESRRKELYGSDSLHATSKRQLSRREIEKFGLPR